MSNFVFVHGGMIGGTSWKKVRKLLEGKNNVLTPTLTGIAEKKHLSHPNVDLETHIQDILNTIYYEELEDVILVGHSYGGMVITAVADRLPEKIKKLVYVAAVLPMNGESMFDAVGPEISAFLYNSAQKGNGWEVPPGTPESYEIQDPEDIKWFKNSSTTHPIKTFQQKISFNPASFEKLNKIYIKCSQDQALESMAIRAENMKIPCYEINTGHFPMITCPEALVELLDLLYN
jgi:pimeloyl-ACP methyl ester carboxylesterase